MYIRTVAIRNRARLLGYLGVLPLLLGAGLLFTEPRQDWVLRGIQNYGAVILTFVGAIHWGRAINGASVRLISFSVLPSLIAWGCLFLPPSSGLPLLTAAFLMVFLFDARQYEDLTWFRQLRTRLTFAVCTLLTVSWATI